MNERYRWRDERNPRDGSRRPDDERSARGQRDLDFGRDEPGWREDDERSLRDRDYYGVSGHRRGEPAPNHAWDDRGEPYPKDVGGINHPGEEPRSFDPLTGDRGSGGPRREDREYRGAQYGQTYGQEGGAPYGREAGYGAGQADLDFSHQAYGPRGARRYVEGGYEPSHIEDEREREARGWWAKARDEFRAWMGDREAERRVHMDHDRDEDYGRHGGDWRGHDDDTGWRDPISAGASRDHPQWSDRARRQWRESRPESPREHRPGWFRGGPDRGY